MDRQLLGEKKDDPRYIRLAELLTRFGASKDEIRWAIVLYEQALAIDEQKVKIPHIEDLTPGIMQFNSHLKSDPQAFVSGRKTNCCSKYGGYAEDRLTHVITDPNWRYVTFTSPYGTFLDGLVWYDPVMKVVCVDNIECQFSRIDKNNPESIATMAGTIIRWADGIYLKMKEDGIHCRKVNVGNDPYAHSSYEVLGWAEQNGLIYYDSNPCDYPERNGISSDARNQLTITSDKILARRRSLF